jgi:CheY-like chemotaxis protein
MITKFSVLYVGQIELDNVGLNGTPANERRYSNERIVEAYRTTTEVAQLMDELDYYCLWMAEHHFQREGYEVLLAENGRAALDLLEREPVDILISDIKMPDMSGVEVLRAAKRVDPGVLGIMITAFASTDTAVDAMRSGAGLSCEEDRAVGARDRLDHLEDVEHRLASADDVGELVRQAETPLEEHVLLTETIAVEMLPHFQPEHFAQLRGKQADRYKQFLKGLSQIEEEGAILVDAGGRQRGSR